MAGNHQTPPPVPRNLSKSSPCAGTGWERGGITHYEGGGLNPALTAVIVAGIASLEHGGREIDPSWLPPPNVRA